MFVVGILAALTMAPPPAVAAASIIWQGFHLQWEHRVAGFETPHRLGSVGVNFPAQRDNGNGTISAVFATEFSPGVDGDVAFPLANFSVLLASADVWVAHDNWTTTFIDNSTAGPVPTATTDLQHTLFLPLPPAMTPGVVGVVLLSGFNISMRCVSTDPRAPCNSNGAWVYHLNMSLTEAEVVVHNGTVGLVSTVSFALHRGWAPLNGSGKPYNQAMEFTVTVMYTVIAGPAVVVQHDRVDVNSTVYAAPVEGVRSVPVVDPTAAAPSNVLAGLRGFSWTLQDTAGLPQRGRYLEQYVFAVTQTSDVQNGAASAYRWIAGLQAPAATTFPANTTCALDVALVRLPGPPHTVQGGSSATGVICEDDKLSGESCAKQGLPAQLRDVHALHVAYTPLM